MKPSYWTLLERKKSEFSPKTFLKISCLLADCCASQLDKLGKEALEIAKGQFNDSSTEEVRTAYVEKLQNSLPADGTVHFYSPIIWALQEHTNSYPAWYSAGIVAGNIEDLRILSEQDITELIQNELSKTDN